MLHATSYKIVVVKAMVMIGIIVMVTCHVNNWPAKTFMGFLLMFTTLNNGLVT